MPILYTLNEQNLSEASMNSGQPDKVQDLTQFTVTETSNNLRGVDYASVNSRKAVTEDSSLIAVFENFDLDGKGYMDGADLSRVLQSMGEDISPSEGQDMMKALLDGRSYLSSDDFMHIANLIAS